MSIQTSLSPNTQKDDLFLSLGIILQPWKWPSFAQGYGRASKNLEEAFKRYHGAQYAYSFNSGRSALMAILYALRIGNHDDYKSYRNYSHSGKEENKGGDEVLIQAFTCNAVPNPIQWSGARPVYVDIDETLNIAPDDFERKITPRTKAVIVQHTFGVPAQMDRILEIARRHNLYVIEDCAHALGAKYQGKLVGTLGDVSFFSFGRDKVISSVYGGMAATNNPEIAKKIEEFWNHCERPSYFWIFQQLAHPIVFAIAIPLYNFFNLGKIMIRVAQKIKLLSFAVTREEKLGGQPVYFPKRMPEALASLALHQFRKLEQFNAHRRTLAEFYQNNIKYNPNLRMISESTNTNNGIFLRWSLLSSKRDKLLRQARKKGIHLGDWYTNVIAPHDTDLEKMHYSIGSCPKAEEASRQIFNLPTHINISVKDAQKIVDFLNTQ